MKKNRYISKQRNYSILTKRHRAFASQKALQASDKKDATEKKHSNKLSKITAFQNLQKQLHSNEISEKRKSLYVASIKKENIQLSIQDELLQIKKLKQILKSQKKELKLTKKEIQKARKKNYGLRSMIIIGLFITISLFLFFTVQWLFRTWPNLQLSELMYQAKVGINGTSKDMVSAFIVQTVVPTISLFLAVLLFFVILAYSGKKLRRFGKMLLVFISIALIVISTSTFNDKLDFINYIKNLNSTSDFIQLHYINPATTTVTFPESKRNLITIYLESMETTFSDKENGGGMDINYIPELTSLANSYENFSGDNQILDGGISLPNTTWTMGGLFASTSGLTLDASSLGNNMDTQTSFFENTTVLGDILEKNGYKNYFACGSNGAYAGRKLYFETHGNFTILDLFHSRNNGRLDPDYYVWWGFEDSKLIEYAKEDLTSIASYGDPFNYTMLTVDTHFEDGYVCEDCEDLYDGNQYGNVIRCSSKKISELITWIQEQPWYDNTTIVLTGDHPTMDSDFCNEVASNYQRRVFTAYINAAPKENNSVGFREYSTMDTFPTILAALGATIEGDKLGLGTNLYSGKSTLLEEYGLENLSYELRKPSEFMDNLANIDYTTSRDVDGFHSSCTTTLDSYHDGIATLIVKDIFGYQEDHLDQVKIRITESSGNVVEQIMKNIGEGIYEASLSLIDDNINNVHVEVLVTSSSDDLTNTIEETFIDYYGNLCLISSTQLDFTNYLKGLLQLDLNRYTIFLTTQGDSASALTQAQIKLLNQLGAGSLVNGKGDTGFAIINETSSYIKNGYGYIRDDNYIDNTNIPYVISSSSSTEDPSSILIGWDYTEYSLQRDGFNFVIWDSQSQSVVNQTAYNTGVYGPQGVISTKKPGFLEKQETIVISNISGVGDTVFKIVGVIYDDTDLSSYKLMTLTPNEDSTAYTLSVKGEKDELKHKSVRIYAWYADFTYRYIGSIHLK